MDKVAIETRGRKPVADKKQQVLVYIAESKIKRLGGIHKVKEMTIKYLENKRA